MVFLFERISSAQNVFYKNLSIQIWNNLAFLSLSVCALFQVLTALLIIQIMNTITNWCQTPKSQQSTINYGMSCMPMANESTFINNSMDGIVTSMRELINHHTPLSNNPSPTSICMITHSSKAVNITIISPSSSSSLA